MRKSVLYLMWLNMFGCCTIARFKKLWRRVKWVGIARWFLSDAVFTVATLKLSMHTCLDLRQQILISVRSTRQLCDQVHCQWSLTEDSVCFGMLLWGTSAVCVAMAKCFRALHEVNMWHCLPLQHGWNEQLLVEVSWH